MITCQECGKKIMEEEYPKGSVLCSELCESRDSKYVWIAFCVMLVIAVLLLVFVPQARANDSVRESCEGKQVFVPCELWTNANNKRSPNADKWFKKNGYESWACSPVCVDGEKSCWVERRVKR